MLRQERNNGPRIKLGERQEETAAFNGKTAALRKCNEDEVRLRRLVARDGKVQFRKSELGIGLLLLRQVARRQQEEIKFALRIFLKR